MRVWATAMRSAASLTARQPARVTFLATRVFAPCSSRALSSVPTGRAFHSPVPAKQGSTFETHCFDADNLLTSHGIDASKCVFVELTSSTRLYNLVIAHFGQATACSFAPINHSAIKTFSLFGEGEEEEQDTSLKLGMGLGVTKLEHEVQGVKHTISAVHQRRGPIVGTMAGVKTWENLVLFVEGSGPAARHVLTDLLEQLSKGQEETGKITIYSFKKHFEWVHMATQTARSLESVVLPVGTKQQVINDIDSFLSPETYRFYNSHGIPYKRSYLFHGVPGSGKTSFLQATPPPVPNWSIDARSRTLPHRSARVPHHRRRADLASCTRP